MISTDAATDLNPAVLNHWRTEEDLIFTVLGRGRAHFTSPAERALNRCTHLANLVDENLLGEVVRTKQVTPEMYFVFAYAYAAFVIIGQSASPSLLRTKGITISPYKYLTQRTTSPHRIIPYGATVRYPSTDSSKETPAWNEAIVLGPAQSRLLPGLASSTAVHDREIYLQDIHSGNFLIQGTLLVDMIEHRPKLTARLAHHARETSPQAVLDQQHDILTDLDRDSAVHTAEPSDVPTMSSTSSASPTPTPDTPDPPTPISVPTPPRPRRSPRFQYASPSTTDPDPDPPSVDRPPHISPSPPSPASSTSRRHAQAARPCYHRPPHPGDDIIVRWCYDDGTSTWLPARVCRDQSRKLTIKDINGNIIPRTTTFVVEGLSATSRERFTKELTASTHGSTWSYALRPHSPSLRERLHYYSVPHSLLELATTSAHNTICDTLPEAQPFIERFRDQLRDATFYGALLHFPLDLSDQGVRNASDSVELPAPSAFASCSQLLNYPLKNTFHDEVPTSTQIISPSHFAQLCHANTTTEFGQLGGSAEHLQYLLSNSFVSLSLLPSDNESQPPDLDQVPAHIAKTLKSDIHHERFELLSSAKTTEHFRSLGDTQRELQFLLTEGHLTLNARPSMYASEVRAMTSDLQHSPKVKFDRIDQALRSQGYYVDRLDVDPPSEEAMFTRSESQSAHPHSETAAPPHTKYNPFDVFEDSKDPDFESVSSAFWTNYDPNSDLRLQLDSIDLEHVQRIHLQFDPFQQMKGDGRQIFPDDLQYDPEAIVEIKDYSPEDKRKYLDAIIKEMAGCADQGVIRLSVVPEGRNSLPARIIVKVKYDSTGAYERHKARWIILGFYAKFGLEYHNTYAPTAMLPTARMLFAIAAKHGLKVSHADIPQTFVQAPIDRSIWVELPKGVSIKSDVLAEFRGKHPRSRVALRLMKSLYGLASSPALFSKRMSSFMASLGYTRSRSDSTLFYKVLNNADDSTPWILVSIFVDDILLTGTDSSGIQSLKNKLKETFGKHKDVTWSDVVTSFLGFHASCNSTFTQYRLSTAHKIKQLLETIKFTPAHKGVRAPWKADFQSLHSSQDVPLTARQLTLKEKLRVIVGTLIYISVTCRPDITTIVNRACQGMASPTRMHLIWLERCLEYLRSHPDLGLVYNADGSPLQPEIVDVLASKYSDFKCLRQSPYICFSDADFE